MEGLPRNLYCRLKVETMVGREVREWVEMRYIMVVLWQSPSLPPDGVTEGEGKFSFYPLSRSLFSFLFSLLLKVCTFYPVSNGRGRMVSSIF